MSRTFDIMTAAHFLTTPSPPLSKQQARRLSNELSKTMSPGWVKAFNRSHDIEPTDSDTIDQESFEQESVFSKSDETIVEGTNKLKSERSKGSLFKTTLRKWSSRS